MPPVGEMVVAPPAPCGASLTKRTLKLKLLANVSETAVAVTLAGLEMVIELPATLIAVIVAPVGMLPGAKTDMPTARSDGLIDKLEIELVAFKFPVRVGLEVSAPPF